MEDRPVRGLELCLFGVVALTLIVGALIGSGGGGKDNASKSDGRAGSAGSGTKGVDVRRIMRRVEHLRSLRVRRRLAVTFASRAQATGC